MLLYFKKRIKTKTKLKHFWKAHPGTGTTKTFYSAWKSLTDGGSCCLISPYLNFVNPNTQSKDPNTYTGEEWHSLPKGSENGQIGGLKFVLDVERFDYGLDETESIGFNIAFSDQRDKPIMKEDGYSISTGLSFRPNILII